MAKIEISSKLFIWNNWFQRIPGQELLIYLLTSFLLKNSGLSTQPHIKNSNAFTSTFKRFVLMLKDLDLIEGETIAIDSFKIFAQNSIRNNFTQKKIDRHIDYIDKKVAEYEAQLNESDAAEDKANLKEKIELKLNRRKKYEELNKALKDSGESQISLTTSKGDFGNGCPDIPENHSTHCYS